MGAAEAAEAASPSPAACFLWCAWCLATCLACSACLGFGCGVFGGKGGWVSEVNRLLSSKSPKSTTKETKEQGNKRETDLVGLVGHGVVDAGDEHGRLGGHRVDLCGVVGVLDGEKGGKSQTTRRRHAGTETNVKHSSIYGPRPNESC